MSSMSCIQGSESPLVVTHKRRKILVAGKGDVNVNVENRGSPINSAVYVRNLCKSYGNSHILKNYCMNVRKGTIYGLLGASGCGKTTVLSTLVGLKKWDSGEVVVFGEPPGKNGKSLGYVPQEAALYDQLSIREMMGFYACMYNMTYQELTERWIFLTKLLELPSNFRLIGDLSGGQKRRASLAVALMHSPSLLVLDEPTVGLDPLLRRSIWNHLYKIVSTLNTTVIITTHYIEEARLSNTIGVMRRGHLLVEDSPTNLLHTFKCNLLEEVVLQLCRKDESGLKKLKLNDNETPAKGNELKFTSNWREEVSSTLGINNDELMDGIFRKAVGFDCDINQNLRRKEETHNHNASIFSSLRNSSLFKSLQRIRGLTTVILLTFIRHPVFISLILLLPTIHGTITLATVGTKPKGMNFGIVNNELLNWTTECDLPKHGANSCDFSALSCKFINQLKTEELLHLSSYNEEKLALEEVKMGRSWGYLKFDANYSQHNFDFLAAKTFASNESIEGSRVRMRMDFSQYIGSIFLVKDLYGAFEDYIHALASSCEIGGREAEVPLHFRPPVYGYNEDNFTEFLIPGVIICCLLGVLGVLTSVIFITDRKQGTLTRAQVAGLRTADVMISHMITQALIALAQIFLWTAVLHIFFGFTIRGPVWLYVLICLMTGLCGAGIGILLGIVCKDEVEAMIFGVFWIPILLLFGGVFWPLECMSPFWKRLGSILPTTLPISSLRSVITRGLGLTHQLVWPGVTVSFAWIVFLSICVVFTYRKYAK